MKPKKNLVAYLILAKKSNGVTVRDCYHDLLVYKIQKKFDLPNPTYLDLPSLKTNQTGSQASCCNNTTHCPSSPRTMSTQLTQNLGLLSLLKWRSELAYLN